MSNFKEKYLKGEVVIRDIDRFVDDWHKNPKGLSIQEYLGFNDEEYKAFLHGESLLERLLKKQKTKTASLLEKALAKIVKK